MRELYFLITIIRREYGEEYLAYFRRHAVQTVFASLCRGTAQQRMLDCLGLEQTEKLMLSAVVTGGAKRRLLRGFVRDMGINALGGGVAMAISLSSLGGASSFKYLTEGQNETLDEVDAMKETRYTLILAITEAGNAELVMDAARKADARGGTVVHAKGTGTAHTSRFLGISIAQEKDMVYIVARREDKDRIMGAISREVGMHTEAHTALLSLPVEDAVGLAGMEEGDEADA